MSERFAEVAAHLSLLVAVLFVTGCGDSFPDVSGKVTYEGEPVAYLKVFFTPLGTKENPAPGPYSTGITDKSGVYSLKTRNKDHGAVVGLHRVGFDWVNGNSDEVSFLKERIAIVKDAGEKAELKEKLKSAKAAMKSRPKIPNSLEFKFEVPAEGTDKADFELNP